MNGLIKIDVNENLEQVVSARELHEKLGIGQRFTDWFKYQTERLGLREGTDFITILGESNGGRPSTDYIIPLDTAKHLCMISGGETAWKLREYFIQVEKAWNSPEQVMARGLQFAHQRILLLEGQIEKQAPKVEVYETLMSAEGDYSLREAAQILSRDPSITTGQNRLAKYLRELKWVDRYGHPYQREIDNGRLSVRTRVYDHPHTGEPQITTQIRITAKGMAELHKRLGGMRPLDASKPMLTAV